MVLRPKTLEKLREIINGDNTAHYRKGYELVEFFNQLGFHDSYNMGQGFPSRWIYTDDKLKEINGTPELDKCIRMAFAVEDYIDNISELDELIEGFNRYLSFDKWKIVRENENIVFKKLDRVVIDETPRDSQELRETEFLNIAYDVHVESLGLDGVFTAIIKERLSETEACVSCGASLAATILIGSILEGILLGVACTYPRDFNQASCAPKEADGSIRRFPDWTLNNFIDVASELGILKQDVKKFSHVVRDFRNYIHPHQQMACNFSPDKHTSLICFQVLKAAIYQIGEYRNANNGGTN